MIWLQQLESFLLEHCHSKLQQMDQFWAHRSHISSLVPGDEALKFFHLARRNFHPKTIIHCVQMNIFGALISLYPNKALGPDGFNEGFFSSFPESLDISQN